MTLRRLLTLLFALSLLAAACGDDDSSTGGDDTADTADTADTDDAEGDTADESDGGPVTGPATIEATSQEGDGSSVTVASVSLPTAGFIVIHADADGGPGPVIGHSDLLAAGESSDVEVTLDVPIEEDATLWPMAHVDANANGDYEFAPPDVTTDVPATTEAGAVAVLSIDYTVAGADLQLSSTDLGDILVDAGGFTVYLFVPDDQGDSACYDECEANWPVVDELATVGAGLDPALLATTTRTTGDVQATYNSWPLYYFIGDAAAGETNGQGINDVWYVIAADGNAIGN